MRAVGTPWIQPPATNLARYQADLDKLVRLGQALELDLTLRHLADVRTLGADEKKHAERLNGTFDRAVRAVESQRFSRAASITRSWAGRTIVAEEQGVVAEHSA